MKKKKSVFVKVLSILMIFCMSFVFVGCMGLSPDEKKEYEDEIGDEFDDEYDGGDGNGGSNLDFDMYGTKVLYRPDGYNYNTGAGGTEEEPNDYYGQYAYNILQELNNTYGSIDESKALGWIGFSEDSEAEKLQKNEFKNNKLPYIYDSIRYQVDTKGKVTATITQAADDTWPTEATPLEEDNQYTIVGADLTNKWNWSFNYDWGVSDALTSPIDLAPGYIKNSHKYGRNFSAISTALYQTSENFSPAYQTIYLGTSEENDYDNYSPYVKALEYAIYCYALDLEPSQIDVTHHDSGDTPYTVKINNISVDEALDNIIALFNKVGSYVGLTNRQVTKLKAWINKNIVGANAKDDFTTYNNVTVYYQKDGTTVDHYEFGTGTTTNLGRNYEEVINNIVDGVCSQVAIGDADGDGNGYIDDEFLASEIMEYAGNTFMIAGDENFSHEEGASKYFIKPLEYQSVTLMLKDQTTIDGMYIALKYDADNDGTEEGVWNLDKYLDIIVELNYFSHTDKKLYTIGSKTARVYDGPFDPYHDNPPDMYEDVGNVYFYDWAKDCPDPGIKAHLDKDECLVIEKGFNTEIGNKALMTDVGLLGHYIGYPLISNNPLVLVGTSPARRYYTLLEPGADEDLGGKTYITGRLNPDKFKGNDGCDYLEITYKVLKNHAADTDTNYKFYTGISFIY